MLVPFVIALITIAALAMASLVQVRRAGRGWFEIAVITVASTIAVALPSSRSSQGHRLVA